MAIERLHFGANEVGFHSYHASQHLVRYSSVRNLVKGKRVLDVACGEGYGSRLLKSWGAKEVVGVDLSDAAIAEAKERFSVPGVRFLVGDAERVHELFNNSEKFDVIISLETIEHLRSPTNFLKSIARLRRTGSVVAISCPNETPFYGDAKPNEFHLQRFDFGSFRKLTEKYLGPAAHWLLGAPIVGECNVLVGDKLSQSPRDDWMAIIEPIAEENVLRLSASSSMALDKENCSHFLGVWGKMAAVPVSAAFSTQSVTNMLEPFRAIDYFKQQSSDFKQQSSDRDDIMKQLSRLTLDKKNAHTELRLLHGELQRLRLHNENLSAAIEVKEMRVSKLEKKLANKLILPLPKFANSLYNRVKTRRKK